MGPSPGGEEYLFKPHPSPVREESLCGFCLLCLQFGDWVFVFSVSLVLFSTLFPGGAAEIDSFGSADPPGLLASLPSYL